MDFLVSKTNDDPRPLTPRQRTKGRGTCKAMQLKEGCWVGLVRQRLVNELEVVQWNCV